MNWGDFKAVVESQGVTDSDEIWYIDISYHPMWVKVERDTDGDIRVTNALPPKATP
jgi:hypothetical protein